MIIKNGKRGECQVITLKCKMCGGALELVENTTVAECEYCGTRQTLPKLDDEKKTALFDRANLCRSRNEFDKAAVIYENILNDAKDEAEAYWGLCLCRYGIEYVVDPKTQKRVPTCHRAQFKTILEDQDYLAAIEYADLMAKDIYKAEAEYIDKIQKDILAISSKEKPFDIFICYKETDNSGERTIDSVLAQDIYTELTEKGYKVFFSRITLEDKLGTAYEPYIFAALNSAKIMLVVGTQKEYFNAVWVRNEWSRYLSLIEQGQKKTIIPCYKDIDAYDLPEEFIALQGQDMGKIGAMQDLIRGIDKILNKNVSDNHKVDVSPQESATVQSLLKRGILAFEDSEWKKANEVFEQILNIDTECAEVYLYKLLIELKLNSIDDLKSLPEIPDSKNYQRATLYATGTLKEQLLNIEKIITERNTLNTTLLSEPRQKANLLRRLIVGKDAFITSDGTVSSKRFKGVKKLEDRYILYSNGDVALRRGYIKEYITLNRWKNIVSVSYFDDSYIGVKKDGSVVAASFKKYKDSNNDDYYDYDENGIHKLITSDWCNIKKALVYKKGVIGLKETGEVVVAGDIAYDTDISSWRDVEDVCCSDYYANSGGFDYHEYGCVGLKKDGTVYAYHPGKNFKFKDWKNIVKIFQFRGEVYGLTSYGIILDGQNRAFRDWTNIVDVSTNGYTIAALKLDGTVVVDTEQYTKYPDVRNVSSWNDVVAIKLFKEATIGIRRDGTILSTEKKYSNIKLFDDFDNLDINFTDISNTDDNDDKEKNQKIRKIDKEIEDIRATINQFEKEFGNSGLFAIKKRNELKNKISDCDTTIKKLMLEKKEILEQKITNRIIGIATDYNYWGLWNHWFNEVYSDKIYPHYGWQSKYCIGFRMLTEHVVGMRYSNFAMGFSVYNDNDINVYNDTIQFSLTDPNSADVLGFTWQPSLNFPSGQYYALLRIDGFPEYTFNFTIMPKAD